MDVSKSNALMLGSVVLALEGALREALIKLAAIKGDTGLWLDELEASALQGAKTMETSDSIDVETQAAALKAAQNAVREFFAEYRKSLLPGTDV